MTQQLLQLQNLFDKHPILFLIIILWILVWKGLALWKAARLSDKRWFVAILLLNTIGILDIIYLYFVARKYTVVSEP